MEHNDVRHMLSEYLDDTVTVEEKAAIEDHLKTCRQCNDALKELRKTIEHIKTVEEIDPPVWMTQKIMAKVRSDAEKKSLFQKLFYPLSIKLPIQTVAVLFLVVTAFYIYKNIEPTQKLSEAPMEEFAPRKETAQIGAKTKGRKITRGPSARAKQPPQTPEYKALDMKLEYEKPASPAPMDKAEAMAPAPAKAAGQPVLAKEEAAVDRYAAAPQPSAPSIMGEQRAVSNESRERTLSKHKSMATAEGTTTPANRFEYMVQERYPDEKPKLVVTFEILGSHRVKRAEERFNNNGERHGLQREYYASGRVKTEARYGYGKLEWYMEFQPDGVKKIGKSDFDWFWLKK